MAGASCSVILSQTTLAIHDANNNGVSDLWEKAHNSGNLFENFDPLADPDGDGWTNAEEAIAGTDPFDANPPDGIIRLSISQIPAVFVDSDEDGIPEIDTPEACVITWPTLAGKVYTLFFSPDLSTGSWLPLDEPRIGDGLAMGNGIPLTQPDGSTPDALFWRVAVADIDRDGDGLTDHEESILGSSSSLADTNGDGTNDGAALSAGLDPSDPGPDTNGDGVPDNEIYTIVVETLSENRGLVHVGYHVLTGVDDDTRHLTTKYSEIYSVSGSPRYADIADGLYSTTASYLDDAEQINPNQSPTYKVEGVKLWPWASANGVQLAPGESVEWEESQNTTAITPTTATVATTTTTRSTPWKVWRNETEIRSGTEIIIETKRTELSKPVTFPQLWATHFKALPWWEFHDWYLYGPPAWSGSGGLSAEVSPATAEWIREEYRSGTSTLFAMLSSPGRVGGKAVDHRLKALRWRWIRFDPLNPAQYDYASPPATYARTFFSRVETWDRLFDANIWTDTITGIVGIRCEGGQGANDWQNVDMSKFTPHRVEDPLHLSSINFVSAGYTNVFIQGDQVDIVPDDNMAGVVGDVVKSTVANSTIKHFVSTKKTVELDQEHVILAATGITAEQITPGHASQIVEWNGGEAVPNEPMANGAAIRYDATRQVRAVLKSSDPVVLEWQHENEGIADITDYPTDIAEGNDDPNMGGELMPYQGEFGIQGIMSDVDSPMYFMNHVDGLPDATFSVLAQFRQYARVQIGGKWFKCSDLKLSDLKFKFKKTNGKWVDDGSSFVVGNGPFSPQ